MCRNSILISIVNHLLSGSELCAIYHDSVLTALMYGVVILHTPVSGTQRHFLWRIRDRRSALSKSLGTMIVARFGPPARPSVRPPALSHAPGQIPRQLDVKI